MKLRIMGLVVAMSLLLPTSVLGHAVLGSSTPARDSTVSDTALRQVQLQFTEPVHVADSVFKVYPLEATDDPLLLRGKAAELVSNVLIMGPRDTRRDEADRSDAGLMTTRTPSAEIVMRLKDNLAPGPYVVMWKIRSVDTHITEGWFIFHIAPGE